MSVLTWEYADTSPSETAKAALATARAGSWASLDPATRVRFVRSLLVLSLQAGRLSLQAPPLHGKEGAPELGRYDAPTYPTAGHRDVASTILRTPLVLLPAGNYQIPPIRTVDGLEAEVLGPAQPLQTRGPDTGIAPIVVIAAMSLCALASVAISHIFASQLDRDSARQEKTKRLLGAQATALGVIATHLEREKQAGRSLEFDAGELEALEALFGEQTAILKHEERPLPVPFDGASNGVGRLLAGAGAGIENAGTGIGVVLPVALAAGVLIWLQK